MANAEKQDTDINALRARFGTVLERRKQTLGTTTETTSHGNKSKNLANPEQGKIPATPGEFDILKLTLTSPNHHPRPPSGYIDLKASWSDLNIYEDIFANSLTGNITLTDGV